MKLTLLATATILAIPAVHLAQAWRAEAQSGVTLAPDQIIAARQAAYDLMAGNVVAMKAAVDAGGPVKQFEDGAKAIAAWARAVPAMFPSGTEKGHETRARPEIWSDRAGFEKAAANLVEQASKLAPLAAANDKDGFAAQYKELTNACGACHKTYRYRTS